MATLRELIKQQIDSVETIRSLIFRVNQKMLPGLDAIEVRVATFTPKGDSYYTYIQHRLTIASSFVTGAHRLRLSKVRVDQHIGPNSLNQGLHILESVESADFESILTQWEALLEAEAARNSPYGVACTHHITFCAEDPWRPQP